jgi:DNA-binding PadR family transcriptional regulator
MKHLKGITDNQLELLKFVAGREADGALADLDQVLEKMSWGPTKESIQFTIRAMIAKGFIEKSGLQSRRGRNRVCFKANEKGKQVLDPRARLPKAGEPEPFVPGSLEPEMDFELA